jgi:hypothetical protein
MARAVNAPWYATRKPGEFDYLSRGDDRRDAPSKRHRSPLFLPIGQPRGVLAKRHSLPRSQRRADIS